MQWRYMDVIASQVTDNFTVYSTGSRYDDKETWDLDALLTFCDASRVMASSWSKGVAACMQNYTCVNIKSQKRKNSNFLVPRLVYSGWNRLVTWLLMPWWHRSVASSPASMVLNINRIIRTYFRLTTPLPPRIVFCSRDSKIPQSSTLLALCVRVIR